MPENVLERFGDNRYSLRKKVVRMKEVIELMKECGEFCTERSHPKLPWLREKIENAIVSGGTVIFDRANIKILTPSFIDEMIAVVALKYGLDVVEKHVSFVPLLEPLYHQQIERGMRLRKRP